jgi:trans-aconitate methyltransferase
VVSISWDAADYRANSTMQLALGEEFLGQIPLAPDDEVLDVGCGDGKLTELVAARVPRGRVVGIDPSAEMIALARRHHPALAFEIGDVRAMTHDRSFTVVVSFTALHWVTERHDAALRAMARALRAGGRLHVQLPGAGNAAGLLAAADEVMARPPYGSHFAGFGFPWLFPGVAAYRPLVEAAGLEVVRIALVPRDVVHRDAGALGGWIRTTWMPYTDRLPPGLREAWIADVVARYAAAAPPDPDGTLHVPSFRLEVEARRP